MTTKQIEKRTSKIDEIQSNQYKFPYHYIPRPNGFPNFSRDWVFSASYIAAINIFTRWFEGEQRNADNHRHMDYGCGDGGFIHNIKSQNKFDDVDFFGIDFDESAIKWASLFSKLNNFKCDDVANLKSSSFDSGSLVEVLEHIPPAECSRFISCIAESLKSGAPLFVTVPSNQKPTAGKHYRHFDFETLTNEFEQSFIVEDVFGFERKSPISRALNRFMKTRWWYLETKITNQFLIESYSKRHSDIKGCGRIGMILRKRQ